MDFILILMMFINMPTPILTVFSLLMFWPLQAPCTHEVMLILPSAPAPSSKLSMPLDSLLIKNYVNKVLIKLKYYMKSLLNIKLNFNLMAGYEWGSELMAMPVMNGILMYLHTQGPTPPYSLNSYIYFYYLQHINKIEFNS